MALFATFTKDLIMDFFIISAERFNLTKEENAQRTLAMAEALLREGLDFIACHGVYKGTAERSFMVMGSGLPTACFIERLAKKYEQESVLEVRELEATLVYFDGRTKPEHIGRFTPYDGDVSGLDAYTKIGTDVYVVK